MTGPLINVALAKEFDPVDCRNIVKASGTYNCLGAKMQLSENLDFEYLENLAQEYWDQQLFTFARFALPLDYNRSQGQLKSTLTSYLNDEKAEGAIFGPYVGPPFGQDSHVSPFIICGPQGSGSSLSVLALLLSVLAGLLLCGL